MLPLAGDIAARFEAGSDSVLLAAAGRSTRSIAKEVGVQPRIVSLWRHRYADHGLEGLQDKPRPGKQPIYTKVTDNRILKLLDKPPPEGFARWTGPCWPGNWAMLTSNMSGGSCAATKSTSPLASKKGGFLAHRNHQGVEMRQKSETQKNEIELG